MKNIIKIIIKELERWRYYLIALAWMMLLIIFTYTAIISDSMMVGITFESAHWNNQYSLISLIVNCGLLFMVTFDYMLAGKSIPYSVVWTIFIGIILAIGIYGHAGILYSNTISDYKLPLNWPPLARWLHLIFLVTLLWLKERAVELDMSEVEYVDTY